MTDTGRASTLVDFVADAAVQSDLLDLDEIDREESHYQLIYAVDSNIFDVYIDPQHMSASSSAMVMGAGDVFRTDPIERKAAITRAVGEYIWFYLTPLPLLLIPPVDVEVASLLRIATRETQQAPLAVESIKSLIAELNAGDLATVEKVASKLANLLSQTTKDERLFHLKNQRRFLSADEVPSYPDAIPKDVARCLRPMSNLEDMIAFANVRQPWEDRLSERTGRRNDVRLQRDIEALARLQVWNQRLAALPNPWRLVYITTDNSLHTMASQVPFRSDQRLTDSHALCRKGTTFRHAYLRHPRSYLDRPNVLRRAARARDGRNGVDYGTSFRFWIDLLVGDFGDRPEQLGHWDWLNGRFELAQSVRTEVLKAAAQRPGLLHEILDRWGQFCRHIESLPYDGPSSIENLNDARRLGYDALQHWIEERLAEIERRVVETWGACVLVFTEARFLFTVLQNQGTVIRHAPRLWLERPEAHALLRKAEGWLKDPGTFDLNDFEVERAKAEQCHNDGYSFFLVTAYLLAEGGHWQSAGFLCAHAASMAARSVDGELVIERRGANGREAAYLEAFCRRHAARTAKDLEPLAAVLDRARHIYRLEKDNDPSLDAVPERFETEQVALHYTILMFEWYRSISRAEPSPPDVERLRSLAQKIGSLKDTVAAERLNPQRSDPNIRETLHSAYRRLLVNLVSIGLMHPEDSLLLETARQAYFDYHASLGDQRVVYPSRYVKVVMTCAGARFLGRLDARRCRREARELLAREQSEDRGYAPITPPYELQRYRLFERSLAT